MSEFRFASDLNVKGNACWCWTCDIEPAHPAGVRTPWARLEDHGHLITLNLPQLEVGPRRARHRHGYRFTGLYKGAHLEKR